VLQALNQASEAIEQYRLCVLQQPAHLDAWSNLAVLYQDGDEDAAALHAYQQALALAPAAVRTLRNYATLLLQLGRYDEAAACCERALQQQPLAAEIHVKLAWIHLVQGDFARGWHQQRWQPLSPEFHASDPPRLIPFPLWQGQSLHDEVLLVTGDQGIGDVVMYASLLPDLLQQVQHVVVECEARLTALLGAAFPAIRFIARQPRRDFWWQAELGRIDCWCRLSELALRYRRTAAEFPLRGGYLLAPATRHAYWRQRLQALGGGCNVGIAWRGGANARTRRIRSIPLQQWQALAALPGVNLVNLQYGDHAQEIADFNRTAAKPLHFFDELDAVANLDDFTALVAALDLVISIDNTTVHIAGALDVPVWALLPSSPDWRWQLRRNDSPWYRSVRLFRAEVLSAAAMNASLQRAVDELRAALAGSTWPLRTPQLCQVLPPSAQQVAATSYAVLINDARLWSDWGYACGSLALHAELRQRYGAVASLPVNDVLALQDCPATAQQFDDDAIYRNFAAKNGALLQLLAAAAVVTINAEPGLPVEAGLRSRYLAHVAEHRLQRRVEVIDESRLPLFIERHFVREPVARRRSVTLIGAAGWNAATMQQLNSLLTQLAEVKVQVELLVGAGAWLANDDHQLTQALAARIGTACQLVLAGSEAEWLQHIASTGVVVTGRIQPALAATGVATPLVEVDTAAPDLAASLLRRITHLLTTAGA
ncbi:MAG TPA: tetratricopeptide repeat-containing glycosyltransferase family protein, partial [Candidatus Acidoferrum sp.]|nr:tetratricopeptide repeat-containing glycosyltransferase family protein [Candidatus Acidoferrum sp.]